MAGYGTGYPNWFICPVARRNRALWSGPDRGALPPGHDVIVLTGRTRRAPSTGKGHPRKLDRSYEYRCECGHVGWTCNADVLTRAERNERNR